MQKEPDPMTRKSTAIAAFVAVAIGAGGFAPAVLAEQPGNRETIILHHRDAGMGPMRGGLLQMACTDEAAERLEIAFVRLSHAITLTTEQQTLFDDLRDTALTAQTAFADTCAAAHEAATSGTEDPGLVERLQARIAIQTAELEAWNIVMPKLEAFVGGLTDEQKAALAPKREHHGFNDDRPMIDGPHFEHHGPDGMKGDGPHGPGFKFHFGPGGMSQHGPDATEESGI
jgi:hypothetical protein